MKLWKIGLYILCIFIVTYWFFYLRNEGFQNPITVQNVSYSGQYNEGYLVSPNATQFPSYIGINDDTLNADGTLAKNTWAVRNNLSDDITNRTYYSDAYTFEEAKAMCRDNGATLATSEQMNILAGLGAAWSVASWASDANGNGATYAIIPKSKSFSVPNTIANTTSDSGSGSWNPLRKFTNMQKAFPVCWGVKPVEPTLDINPFNRTEYSMFTSSLLSSVMYPGVGELFQGTFSADQAVYALQKNNYNIGDAGLNPARTMLISNSGTTDVNKDMYEKSVGSQQYAEDQINNGSGMNPCTILSKAFTTFKSQFTILRTTMEQVNNGVLSMESAKEENARFQMNLDAICEIESPTTSPACAKLATLDFDLLYSTTGNDVSTSRLAALESLNNTLFQRQQEMCLALMALSQVQGIIPTCPSSSAMLPSECSCKDVTTGSAADSSLCPSNTNTRDQGSYTWTVNGVKPNDVEYLKLLLQQISPYFGVSTYKTLLDGVISQLAITIELPSLNDFNTTNDNLNAVNKEIVAIDTYLKYSGGN